VHIRDIAIPHLNLTMTAIIQGEIQRLRDKITIAERSAKVEAQINVRNSTRISRVICSNQFLTQHLNFYCFDAFKGQTQKETEIIGRGHGN
jgi:hypothetical protein